MKVEANNPTNANVEAVGKRAFEMPLFELPKMAMPGVFLALQLPFCFEVGALSGSLVSSTPE
jgi:hypothetical protein